MDIKDLFLNCKIGDLSRVQYLVEQREVELNIRDKWDSTPLYYACLCGHEDLVKYLLLMGAKCEANTFEGERCMYGALSNSIRNMLKNFKQVTSSTMRRNMYLEFMRKLLDRGLFSDVTFIVHGEHYPVHRCILSARSKYFSDLLNTKWRGKETIHLTHKLIIPTAFRHLLRWIYTGHLNVHLDDVEDVIRLVRQCQLSSLMEELEDKLKKVLSFEINKPGVVVTVLSVEPEVDCRDLQEDFSLLADLALPAGFHSMESAEFPFIQDMAQIYPDVIFSVQGYHFHCHKAFFMARSDYFRALDEDHFGENLYHACNDCDLPVITVSGVTASVFAQVMNFVYQEKCEVTECSVYDVLYAADMYLLPGLKHYCSLQLIKYIDSKNVFDILKTARIFNLHKLEDASAEFLAHHLDEKLLESGEFEDLVREDAHSVKHREETDSIPIIDEIRFHLTSVQTVSDMYETDQKLALIDNFLQGLHLDA